MAKNVRFALPNDVAAEGAGTLQCVLNRRERPYGRIAFAISASRLISRRNAIPSFRRLTASADR